MKYIFTLFISLLTTTICFSQTEDPQYCAKISTKKDKINNSLSYKSPESNEVVFSRFSKKTEFIYMIELKRITKKKDSGYGVTILLKNGERIYRHIRVAIRITDDKEFEHFTNFKLEKNEIELLQKTTITDIILHKINFVVKDPEKYKAYITCLTNLK